MGRPIGVVAIAKSPEFMEIPGWRPMNCSIQAGWCAGYQATYVTATVGV